MAIAQAMKISSAAGVSPKTCDHDPLSALPLDSQSRRADVLPAGVARTCASSSDGTGAAHAASASALRSRLSERRPDSFSTCTITTVPSGSASTRCRMSASKAFASASRSSGLKTESTGLAVAPS